MDDLSMPLRECGEIAVLRLSDALSEALEQAVDQLFNEAARAQMPQERDALVDAADFARVRRHALVCDFMRFFEQRYVRACEQKHDLLATSRIDFDEDNLKVVEHYLLDDSLDPGKIAEAIQNSSWQTLQRLTAQFQLMLKDQYLQPIDLPLGPKVIEAAVADAIREQLWRQKAKPKLAKALRWTLASRVGLFYRDLADHLNARDLRLYSRPAKLPMAELASTADGTPAAPVQEPPEAAIGQPPRAEIMPAPLIAALPPPPRLAEAEPATPAQAPHPVKDVFQRMQQGVPGLLKRLNQGLESIPLAREVRQRLTASHDGEANAPLWPVATEADAGQALPEPLAQPPGATTSIEPEREGTPPAAELEPPPEIVAETVPAAPPPAPKPDEMLKALSVGNWLRFRDTDGTVKELKLAWISPRRSLFLLTNRDGERALSLSAVDFAKAMEEDRVQPLGGAEDTTPFPMRDELRKTA